MNTCWDIYDKIRIIVKNLEAINQKHWKDRVDCCLYGSTSGEILGDISVALQELLNSKLDMPEQDCNLVQETLTETNTLLTK